MKHSITLSELQNRISNNIKDNFPDRYFIVAEISELNESRGHAYLELSEKNEEEVLVAKARATIWARTYRMLKPYFESATGHKFEAGLKVLIVVTVEFHEVYGFSLNVKDIDPNYTVGDIERKRLMIIQRLEEDGVMDMNKELELPIVPQKIAIISSETAAGYGDFMDQITNNDYGFKFYTKLFSAAMQGEETESSVINALEQIFEYEDVFDLVVIIRGGGSKSDLSWFDSYQMALNISQFSLPVLCGIGHEKDSSIIDLVAHTSLKTPTAVANFLIDNVAEYNNYLSQLSEDFFYKVKELISESKNDLDFLMSNFKPIVNKILMQKTSDLEFIKQSLKNVVQSKINDENYKLQKLPVSLENSIYRLLNNEEQSLQMYNLNLKNLVKNDLSNKKHKLGILEQKNNLLSPDNILKRGYSLSFHNKRLIKSVKDIKKGELIETKLIDGSFKSKVEN